MTDLTDPSLHLNKRGNSMRSTVQTLNDAGIPTYERDGMPGAFTAEVDEFLFDFDQAGVFDVLVAGETNGNARTLHFTSAAVHDAVRNSVGTTLTAENLRVGAEAARSELENN